MKKGVHFRRALRRIIVVIIIFFMALGFYHIYGEPYLNHLQKESNEVQPTISAEAETTLSEVETTVSEAGTESQVTDATEEIIIETTQNESEENQEEIQTSSDASSDTISESTESAISIETEDVTQNEDDSVGIICLTFDDGPSIEITNQILDILEEKGVKATFFILDYDSEKLAIINREIQDGHTVGIHGYSHDYSSIYSSLDAITSNFTTLQEKLYNDTGYYATFIRFPGGASNTVSKKYCTGIMTAATQTMTDMGFVYFDWNVDSNDAGGASSSDEIYNNVTSTLVEGRTNVVLMHDAANKIYTLEALPRIIDYGLENGFEFQAITSDTTLVQHGVNN